MSTLSLKDIENELSQLSHEAKEQVLKDLQKIIDREMFSLVPDEEVSELHCPHCHRKQSL